MNEERSEFGGSVAAEILTAEWFCSASVDPGTQRADSGWSFHMVGRRQVRPLSKTGEAWAAHDSVEGRGHPGADRSTERLTMKRRKIDPRRAKLSRTYTVEETARLFGCHRNTVRAWLGAGLLPIDGQRPTLILGEELRRFHQSRRANRKRPTPTGMIYCVGCREPRRPAGDMADYLPRTDSSGDLQGICPECNRMMFRRVSLPKLEQVRGGLDVTMTKGDGRISKREEPSPNHDSGPAGFDHAESQRGE